MLCSLVLHLDVFTYYNIIRFLCCDTVKPTTRGKTENFYFHVWTHHKGWIWLWKMCYVMFCSIFNVVIYVSLRSRKLSKLHGALHSLQVFFSHFVFFRDRNNLILNLKNSEGTFFEIFFLILSLEANNEVLLIEIYDFTIDKLSRSFEILIK